MGSCCCSCPEIRSIRASFYKSTQGTLSNELVLIIQSWSESLRLELNDPHDLYHGFSGMKVYRRSDSAEIGELSWTTDNTETGGSSQIEVQHAGVMTLTLNESTDSMVVPGTCTYVVPDVRLVIPGASPQYYGNIFSIGGDTQ